MGIANHTYTLCCPLTSVPVIVVTKVVPKRVITNEGNKDISTKIPVPKQSM